MLFPHITHVFSIDPDWVPNAQTLRKADLEMNVNSYQFKVWDRSGMSTRKVNWLARHVPGLKFEYYVHEDFRMPDGMPPKVAKELAWEVSEVEPQVSWHTHVGHGRHRSASRSHKRYYFDLELLEREQADARYTNSTHTLFYLGLVHAALLEGTEGYKPLFLNRDFEPTSEMRHHLHHHVMYLERFIGLHAESYHTEYVFLALRWIAYAYQFLLLQPKEAEMRYRQCIDYDTSRVDCKIELSKLYTFSGKHEKAWEWAMAALGTAREDKAWTHTYMIDCVTPIQVSRAALNIMAEDNFDGYNPRHFAAGYLSMKRAREICETIILEPEDILQQLDSAYDVVRENKNITLSYQDESRCIEITSGDNEEDSNILDDVGLVYTRRYCKPQAAEKRNHLHRDKNKSG